MGHGGLPEFWSSPGLRAMGFASILRR